MADSPDYEGREAYELEPEEFDDMLGSRKISHGHIEHVTYSDSEAYTIMRHAADHDYRVGITMRDGASDLAIPIIHNEGHSPGASASWLIDEVIGDKSSIARDIAAQSRNGEIARPDGWIIDVYTDWRVK